MIGLKRKKEGSVNTKIKSIIVSLKSALKPVTTVEQTSGFHRTRPKPSASPYNDRFNEKLLLYTFFILHSSLNINYFIL